MNCPRGESKERIRIYHGTMERTRSHPSRFTTSFFYEHESISQIKKVDERLIALPQTSIKTLRIVDAEIVVKQTV